MLDDATLFGSSLLGSPATGLAVALGIGLLIGLERERRKRDSAVGMAGGLRTHAVVALAGALAMQFPGLLLVAAGALFVGALVVVAYWRSRSVDPGVTSEVTLFTTYLLGAYATVQPALAAAIGVVVALTLLLREALHRFGSRTLTEREVLDMVLLAAAALVLLPLLPDRAVDGLGVVNPRRVGQLTLLVLAINGLGHVALRWLGPGRGLPLAGFFGGFVSSAATIGAMGLKVRAMPTHTRLIAAAALCSSIATALQVLMVLSVVHPPLMVRWILPALLMAAVAVASAWFFWRDGATVTSGDALADESRAFQPLHALAFSATVTALTWAAAWLVQRFGEAGALVGIGLGGFADAHSATASAGTLAAEGVLALPVASLAILLALAANTITKIVVAATTGGLRYAMQLAGPHLAMLAAAGTSLAVAR
ncbi:MAG: MgtC/SapB family protein [Gammaproteobacteria bacterium]